MKQGCLLHVGGKLSGGAWTLCIVLLAGMVLPVEGTEDNDLAIDGMEERILVTGSHILRMEQESGMPLLVIEKEEIESAGALSLSEFLQQMVFSGGGTFDEQFTEGFAPGAAGFDFRGFRTDRTLVLLNGRRLPIYPFGNEGSVAFVDINAIPLASIERLEILKDGASATYGSDAISGVLNVITIKEFDGSKVNLFGGVTQRGGGEEGRLSFTTGQLEDDREMAFVFEYTRSGEILGGDRRYANTLNGPAGDLREAAGYPGSFSFPERDPLVYEPQEGCPEQDIVEIQGAGRLCFYDWAPLAQLEPETERVALSSAMRFYHGDFSTFLRYNLSRVETVSNGFFSAVSSEYVAIDDNGNSVLDPIVLLPGTPSNPGNELRGYLRAFPELGPPTVETDSLTHNITVGMSGIWGDFDWELGANYVWNRVDETYASGWMSRTGFDNLRDVVSRGLIDITQPLSPVLREGFTESFKHFGRSAITIVDSKLSGPLMEFSTGPLWMAAGFEFRHASFEDTSDDTVLRGDVLGLGSSQASGRRDAFAGYLELALPIKSMVEFSAAVRVDHYDDFGLTANPKLGVKLTPIDSLLLRYSVGTGFKAPGMHELNSSAIVGSELGVNFSQRGNQDLEAERSLSQAMGIIFNPSHYIELGFDFWMIDAENLVSSLGVANILERRDSEGFMIIDGQRLDVNGDGRITSDDDQLVFFNQFDLPILVVDPFLNVAEQSATGFDGNWRLNFEYDIYSISWQTHVSYLSTLEREAFQGAGIEELVGEYRFPQWRANSLIRLETGRFSQTIAAKYIEEFNGISVNPEVEAATIGSWLTFDYQLGYRVSENSKFVLGVKNVADEAPPQDLTEGWPYFNKSLHHGQGRFFYLEWDSYF